MIYFMIFFAGINIIPTFAPSKQTIYKMTSMFTYILLCGIIILLSRFSGSECRA